MGPDAYASLISFDFDLMASIVVSGVARMDDLSQKGENFKHLLI